MSQKTIPILLIPIFCLFTYQAIKNSISAVHLDNAYFYLQQIAWEDFPKVLNLITKLTQKSQKALSTVETLTPNDPNYHNLMANLKIWQAIINQTEEKSPQQLKEQKVPDEENALLMKQAQKHYLLGLLTQPNNPFLWIGLAKTDLATPKEAYSVYAISQANNFAPSDQFILKHTVLWKLPLWQQLNLQQQEETIKQLKQLNVTKKTSQELKKILKENAQKTTICSKLTQTKLFKKICN